MTRDIPAEIQKAAREWDALRARVRATAAQRDASEQNMRAWQDACAAWHGYRSILDTFWRPEALQQLEQGDPELLELALGFVEANAFYFRSGYLKQRLFRRLRRMKLTETQRQRVLAGVLGALHSQRGEGWSDFCLLAAAFADAAFVAAVSEFVSHRDAHVARRARILLKHLRSA